MWKWHRKPAREEPPPLVGAPPVRRQKTYSADSGYVYQYFFEGYRVAVREERSGTEYVFDVTADRKTHFPVSVILGDDTLGKWERYRDRQLDSTERYAIAKMALFAALDERESPAEMRSEVSLRPADLEDILDTLGIE